MNKYTKSYNVILDDMDLNEYRIRPISVITYLQDAFARYTATKKMAAYDLFSENLYWVVAEFNMDFIDDLPFWSEEIRIELWFSEISKLKAYIDFNIYYNDKIFTKGNALWFLIDKTTRRPVKTDLLKERFQVCDELVLGEHRKFILPESVEKHGEISHTNNLSDIDFNNHVNNKSYINIAETTAPEEFKQTHTLKRLHIRFNKETFLGDTLICSSYKTKIPQTYIYVIKKDDSSVCDIAAEWKDKSYKTNIVDYGLNVKTE